MPTKAAFVAQFPTGYFFYHLFVPLLYYRVLSDASRNIS